MEARRERWKERDVPIKTHWLPPTLDKKPVFEMSTYFTETIGSFLYSINEKNNEKRRA